MFINYSHDWYKIIYNKINIMESKAEDIDLNGND